MNIAFTENTHPGTLPPSDQLGFGSVFTDHMFLMDYSTGKGWHDARIVPYQPLELDLSLEFCGYGKASHTAIYGDPEEGNSPEKPDCVTEMFVSDNPVCDGRARITLKPLSWNVIELS